MKFAKILPVLFLLLLCPFVAAAAGDVSGFPPVDTSGFNQDGFGNAIGSQGNQPGFAAGDAGGQLAGSAMGAVSDQVGQIVAQVVQFLVMAFIIVGVILLVWLVIVLIVLRNIMKREDLTGGEKAAWVLIVLFCGVLPLSPIGILLYAISGGKKQDKEKK